MKSELDKEASRQPYEKPRLRMIELVAEEVLGVGCKTNVSPGPKTICADKQCHAVGS